MAADAEGNDIQAVGLPWGGFVALTVAGTMPTELEGADPNLVLSWTGPGKLGLLTTDGGPEWPMEPAGDPIEFWQPGYSIPNGEATCQVKFKMAETNPQLTLLQAGVAANANGYSEIDAGGHVTTYKLFVAEVFKSGLIRRRANDRATIASIVEDKSTRGEAKGYEVTMNLAPSATYGNKHFGQWLINP